MFSKKKLEFLRGEADVSEGYRRVLQHRINKKRETLMEVLPRLI